MDERYAAVDVLGKGLVIFSALSAFSLVSGRVSRLIPENSCSHAGIVNVVKDAVEKFSRPIYMVLLSSCTWDCRFNFYLPSHEDCRWPPSCRSRVGGSYKAYGSLSCRSPYPRANLRAADALLRLCYQGCLGSCARRGLCARWCRSQGYHQRRAGRRCEPPTPQHSLALVCTAFVAILLYARQHVSVISKHGYL
jgi:hypothetical protein